MLPEPMNETLLLNDLPQGVSVLAACRRRTERSAREHGEENGGDRRAQPERRG
jgi:hypothetical protein